MTQEKRNSKTLIKKNILSNWYVQLFILTLVGAVINYFVWTSSLIITIFEKIDLNKGEQLRLILKHDHSPLKADIILGFAFSCIIMIGKSLFEIKKKKKIANDYNED